MNTWPAIILITLSIFFTLHNMEVAKSDDDLGLVPEFCVAMFLVSGDKVTATEWLNTYDLDAVAISFFGNSLGLLILEDEMTLEELTPAIAECKAAHEEANKP